MPIRSAFKAEKPGHRILGGKAGIHSEFAVIPLGKIEAGTPADTDNAERSRRFPAGGDASLLNVRQYDLVMASDQPPGKGAVADPVNIFRRRRRKIRLLLSRPVSMPRPEFQLCVIFSP